MVGRIFHSNPTRSNTGKKGGEKMGISISLLVSKAVPQEKWEAVYDEALALAKKLDLACIKKKEILGKSVYCLVPVEEEGEAGKTCWHVCSDLVTRESAEWYTTPKILCDPSEGDDPFDIIIHRALDRNSIYDEVTKRAEKESTSPRHLWGNKTQGHYYHIAMLAIGCLIQDRLGNRAYVHGDINAGQCRRAVELANKYLEKPIQIPCQADLGRWIERVNNLPLPENDRVRIAFDMFIGAKKALFGETVRKVFSHESLMSYWKNAFDGYDMNVVGYSTVLKSFLSMGFEITDLCDVVSFTSSKGEDQRERFIRSIMDSKLHWLEKDCTDWMEHDPDDPALYGIEALFIRAFSFGVRNKKVDRYIPLEEIRQILIEKIPDFDVNKVIDDYIAGESIVEDKSAEVNRLMNQAKKELENKDNDYDIPVADYLPDYQTGKTMAPDVEELVRGIMEFWQNTILNEENYKRIMAMPRDEKLDWIAYQSRFFPSMTQAEWQRVMESVDSGNLNRYAGLFCIKRSSEDIAKAVSALVTNDSLYEYAKMLCSGDPTKEAKGSQDNQDEK